MFKTASNIKKFDDVVELLSKNNINGSAKEIADNLILGHSTGSLMLDGVGSLVKKISGGKNVTDKYKDARRKLSDLDIKAGSKVYDKLNNSNKGKKISNAFLYNHKVPLKDTDKYLNMDVPMLSAPLENSKNTVLPFVGGMYITDKIMGISDKKDKGGDMVKNSGNLSREELIQKVAHHISGYDEQPGTEITDEKNVAGVFLLASKMLKQAAEEKRQMENDMEKLANENKQLHESMIRKDKTDKAKRLAEQMNDKGMIAKSDIEKKAEEIISLDDDAYTLLKNAVESANGETKKDGIDNLTFLVEDNNIKSSDKTTLADALGD